MMDLYAHGIMFALRAFAREQTPMTHSPVYIAMVAEAMKRLSPPDAQAVMADADKFYDALPKGRGDG